MVCSIKQRLQIADMTLWSKVKVTHTKNLSMAKNANTSFIFGSSVYIFATMIIYHVQIIKKYQSKHMTLKSRVKSSQIFL